ncbi:S8 family serine peptidase [Archangium sp.]|uniref:S8 family serine peptidase n=1 Tax=Archangium sp. TaxID=1872627 RepID=UPI00286C1099|nr:S8 family serine peptidase [Archangium sp.]
MKLKLTQTLLTCSMIGLAACEPMTEQEAQVIESKEVGQTAQFIRSPNAVRDEYIVVLRDSVERGGSSGIARAMANARGGEVLATYEHALKGFAVRMPEARVRELLNDPRVAYIEENGYVQAIGTQTGATWGIDRIDQTNLPLNSTYNYNFDGTGVHAYIIDTGVRLTHSEFTGRIGTSYDAVTTGGNANDCQGHGTHVAATVAGTTYGVAKKATVHAVRVLNCQGSGTNADVIEGMDWVTSNHVKPAVANMSLGGGASQATDDAVQRMFAAGVTVAVAAGNDNSNACNYSPARAANAITVGSTTNTDARSSFSNFGTCLDIYAPGSNITSAGITSDTSTATMSGTSMASPHVAGVAALYLQNNPTATAQAVRDALVAGGITGVVSGAGTGSPNVLLNALLTGGGGTPPPPPPPCTPVTLSNGVTVTGIAVDAGAWSCNYTLSVPSGASNLTFAMSGGTGDADMFVKFGAEPTSSVYDCRPYASGNTENCSFAAPQVGTYYVKINGYSAASGVTLKGSFSTGTTPPPTGGTLTSGIESAQYSGASASWTCNTLVVPAGKTSVVFNQTGKTGTTGDADLYVRLGSQPTTTTYNCRPYLSGNTESCTISNPVAGTYYACSYGFSAYTAVTMKGTF